MNVLVLVSSFLAAGVEWVEALTIVLAVGMFKSWRTALLGTLIAILALAALVAVFGFAITSYVSITLARTLVGLFLLLFGLKWLHKAILRSSGLKALHNEAEAFKETEKTLLTSRDHWIGLTTSFNGVFLEGLEVVFIVIALGGLNSVAAASSGALASLVVVVGAGLIFRHPLTRVPENAMKYVVGVMLTSFGTFFTGEGLGVHWPGDDAVILALIAVYGLSSVALVQLLKNPPSADLGQLAVVRFGGAVLGEVWGLFVDDGALATVAVAIALGVGLFAAHGGQPTTAGVFLVAGVILAVIVGLAGSFRSRAAIVKARAHGAQPQQPSAAAPAGVE
jgi:Ca2+/H+ antiporter, TMEM165/GDT1 family